VKKFQKSGNFWEFSRIFEIQELFVSVFLAPHNHPPTNTHPEMYVKYPKRRKRVHQPIRQVQQARILVPQFFKIHRFLVNFQNLLVNLPVNLPPSKLTGKFTAFKIYR
jgi:hypothetical protein